MYRSLCSLITAFVVVTAAVLLPVPVSAQCAANGITCTLYPTDDTFVDEYVDDLIDNRDDPWGDLSILASGRYEDKPLNQNHRGVVLMRFDLTPLLALPPGSNIRSVELRLWVVKTFIPPGKSPVEVRVEYVKDPPGTWTETTTRAAYEPEIGTSTRYFYVPRYTGPVPKLTTAPLPSAFVASMLPDPNSPTPPNNPEIALKGTDRDHEGFLLCSTEDAGRPDGLMIDVCAAEHRPSLFITIDANDPPGAAGNPQPADAASGLPLETPVVLQWGAATDPDAEPIDTLSYRVEYSADGIVWQTTPRLTTLTTTFPIMPLAEDHVYYWRVIVSDSYVETVGPIWSFRSFPLARPSRLAMANRDQTWIQLRWSDNSQNETSYVVETAPYIIGKSAITADWRVASEVRANTSLYMHYGVDCSLSYYFRIKAHRASDQLESPPSDVMLMSPRACNFLAPVIMSPTQGQQLLLTDPLPDLTWTEIKLATEYKVFIGTQAALEKNPAFTFREEAVCGRVQPGVCRITAADLGPTFASAAQTGTFNWGVQAVYGSLKRTSTLYSFTRAGYIAPQMISPLPNETIKTGEGNLTYRWTGTLTAREYTLSLRHSAGQTFQQMVAAVDVCQGTDCAYTPGSLNPTFMLNKNGAYALTITASGPAGVSIVKTMTFTLQLPAPAIPQPQRPTLNETLTSSYPLISWTRRPYASWYQLTITGPTPLTKRLSLPELTCDATLCSVQLMEGLSNGSYQYKVRAYGPSGTWTVDSAPLAFKVSVGSADGTFRVLRPLDDETLYDPRVLFEWAPHKEAQSYTIKMNWLNSRITYSRTFAATMCLPDVCRVTAAQIFNNAALFLPDDHNITWDIIPLKNNHVIEDISDQTFYMDWLPSIPLHTPAQGALVTSAEQVFTWGTDPLNRADRYDICLKLTTSTQKPDCWSVAPLSFCANGICTFDLKNYPNSIRSNGLYTWTVSAWRSTISTAYKASQSGQFNSLVLPPAPRLLEPLPTTRLTTAAPTFRWQHDSRYSRYTLELWNTTESLLSMPGLDAAVFCADGLTCAYDFAAQGRVIPQKSVLNWRVKGEIKSVQTLLESRQNLDARAIDLPNTVVLLSPTVNAIIDPIRPVFTWRNHSAFGSFMLRIYDNSGKQYLSLPAPLDLCVGDVCTYAFTEQQRLPLTPFFTWEVSGTLRGTAKTYKNPTPQRVNLRLIALKAPISNASLSTLQPTFQFIHDPRIDQYQLIIRKNQVSYPFTLSAAAMGCSPFCTWNFATSNQVLPFFGSGQTWQIQGLSSGVLTAMSEERAFTVSGTGSIDKPRLLAPQNSARLLEGITIFTWGQSQFASYTLTVMHDTTLLYQDAFNAADICVASVCSVELEAKALLNGLVLKTNAPRDLKWTVQGRLSSMDITSGVSSDVFALNLDGLLPRACTSSLKTNCITMDAPNLSTVTKHGRTPFTWGPYPFEVFDFAVITVCQDAACSKVIGQAHFDRDEVTTGTKEGKTYYLATMPSWAVDYNVNGRYWWKLTLGVDIDDQGSSISADIAVQAFTINFLVPSFTLSSPLNNAQVTGTDTLRWTTDPFLVDEYLVVIKDAAGNIISDSRPLVMKKIQTGGDNTSFEVDGFVYCSTECKLPLSRIQLATPDSTWGEGKRYSWYVIAYNSMEQNSVPYSRKSDREGSFTLVPRLVDPPSLISPLDPVPTSIEPSLTPTPLLSLTPDPLVDISTTVAPPLTETLVSTLSSGEGDILPTDGPMETPVEAATEVLTVTVEPTATETPLPTETPVPLPTFTETPIPTETAIPTETLPPPEAAAPTQTTEGG